MNKRIILLFLTVIFLGSCKTKGTQIVEAKEAFILPERAIPIVYRGHIYIKSTIDSISGNYVFDTGADALCFDSTFYANNTFPKFKFIKGLLPGVGTSGGQSIIVITDTINLKFGNYIYKPTPTVVMKLKPILGDFADGIIGQSYFSENKYLLEINYFHQYLILHTDTNAVDLSEYTKVKMERRHNRFFVPTTIQINDTLFIQEDFTLDIGSGGAFSMRAAIAEKYNLHTQIANKVNYYTKYGGVGGHSSNVCFRANSIEIGGYKLDGVIMDCSEDKSGAMSQSFYSGGLLGNKILEHFDIVIDFGDSTALYLKPNQNYNKPFKFSKQGFKYVDRSQTLNAWIVSGFYKESLAEQSGLQIDDQIISINGTAIREISYEEQQELWEHLDKVVLVVLRDGKEKRIEFELKPVTQF